MRKRYLRSAVLFLATMFQISFASFTGIGGAGGNTLLFLCIVWTAMIGFERALPWVLGAGLLSDLMRFTPLGMSPAVFILAAYSVSFFSRRFFLENRAVGAGSLVAIALGFSLVEDAATSLVLRGRAVFTDEFAFEDLLSSLLADPLGKTVGRIMMLVVCYFIVDRVERYAGYYENRIKLKK